MQELQAVASYHSLSPPPSLLSTHPKNTAMQELQAVASEHAAKMIGAQWRLSRLVARQRQQQQRSADTHRGGQRRWYNSRDQYSIAVINQCTYSTAGSNQCAYSIAGINQRAYSTAGINQCAYIIAGINQCTYSTAGINQCTYSTVVPTLPLHSTVLTLLSPRSPQRLGTLVVTVMRLTDILAPERRAQDASHGGNGGSNGSGGGSSGVGGGGGSLQVVQ
jgi:uncharacterized membrane protein YgcG